MPRLIAVFIMLSLASAAALPSAAPQNLQVIDHLEPKPDSTGGVPPRFKWTAVKGAEQYVISLWNDNDVLLWRQYLSDTTVPWPKPLQVDEGTYFWVVGALRQDQLVADSGRAAFVILNTR